MKCNPFNSQTTYVPTLCNYLSEKKYPITPNVQKTLILFDLLKVLLSLTYYTWVQILVVLEKTPTNTVQLQNRSRFFCNVRTLILYVRH